MKSFVGSAAASPIPPTYMLPLPEGFCMYTTEHGIFCNCTGSILETLIPVPCIAK